MRNNNQAIVRKITSRTLHADKRRNFFIIAAIALTTFMIASVFSIGVSYYESMNMHEKRLQGSISHMAFAAPSDEELEKIYSLDYIKAVGLGAYIAQTSDFPKLGSLDIAYVDKTQWDEMFCPTFTHIIGHYPVQENEIMLSRYLLDSMGIENPAIGMEIPMSYTVNGTDAVKTETFVLSCMYTEYASVAGNKFAAVYTAPAFAKKAGNSTSNLTNDLTSNLTSDLTSDLTGHLPSNSLSVNVLFKDAKRIGENIERLKQDLAFAENRPYVQSPAFTENYGNTTTYIALLIIISSLMFAGYLLIYNVMYISISKDVRFYGMLKTLGTTPRQIRRIVMGQLLRLCLLGVPVGGLAAAAVSLILVPAILANSGLDSGAVVSFSPVIYLGAAVFAVTTALTGAVAPAKKAAGITPIEALKYTGEEPRVSSVQAAANGSVNGKPYKMAIRYIFRDRKRAAVVMLSLFLGITVFITIMTVIASMDIHYRVNAEYAYDFSFSANVANTYYLSKDFVDEVKAMEGVTETAVTTIAHTELVYSERLDRLVDWLGKEFGEGREDILTGHAFNTLFGIKGIDPLTLSALNKTLTQPIDPEAFERGEIALINIQHYADMADCFADVSTLSLRLASEETPEITPGLTPDITPIEATAETSQETSRVTPDETLIEMPIGGVVSLAYSGVTYSPMEILVSNAFMQSHYPQAQLFSLDMLVENGYDEPLYRRLEKTVNPAEVRMVSRYAARLAMQDAKTLMLVLGGGISCILGLIGVFNFINVISVGVMVRKRELATLESMGMSKRQLRSMLRNEGIGYAVITMGCSLTLGNAIAYALFLLYRHAEKSTLFTYPLIPVLITCAALSLICLITPEIVYKGLNKATLVERLKAAE